MLSSDQLKQLTDICRKASCAQTRSRSFWEAFDKLDSLCLEEFAILSAGALRRLGREIPPWNAQEKLFLEKIDPLLAQQSGGFLGRFLLICQAPDSTYVEEILTRGDDGEQAAAVRAINLRDDAESYKERIVHVCRTNSTLVFAAVSQHNSYPGKHFSDAEFKQMTMKTIFMGLNFEDIKDMEARFHGDLGKSLSDFFEERRSAGRWLPDSVLKFMEKKGLLP
jgi:hypothetical protein